MREPRYHYPFVAIILSFASSASNGDTAISLSLVNPGSATVRAGTSVALEVRGSFDARLSATAFSLIASGDAELIMIGRSAVAGLDELTYVALTSQDPNEDDLPHTLSAAKLEVLFDNDFDAAPGGASDGLTAGLGMLIEHIFVRPRGLGSVDLTLSNVAAVHSEGPPSGALFDVTGVGNGILSFTVVPGPGDPDTDGFVTLTDHAQLPGCLTGPDAGPAIGACDVFDFGPDDDVDLGDVAEFQKVFGPP